MPVNGSSNTRMKLNSSLTVQEIEVGAWIFRNNILERRLLALKQALTWWAKNGLGRAGGMGASSTASQSFAVYFRLIDCSGFNSV